MSDPKIWNGTAWVRPRFWDGSTWREYLDPTYSIPTNSRVDFSAGNDGWETYSTDNGWTPAPWHANGHILTPAEGGANKYPAEIDLRSPQTPPRYNVPPGRYRFRCSYRLDALSNTFPEYGIRLDFSAYMFYSWWGGSAGTQEIISLPHAGTGGSWVTYESPLFDLSPQSATNVEMTMAVSIDADYFGNADYYRLWLDWAEIVNENGQPPLGLSAPGWQPYVWTGSQWR